MFTIICLLYLCSNREYPGSEISQLFFQMRAQVYCVPGQAEGRKKPFLEWTTSIYGLNSLLHVGVTLTIIKGFIILLLLYLWEQGTPRKFSKPISNLVLQLNVQVYSLLGQNEGDRKAFFEGYKKMGHIVRLPSRALGCHKR